MNRLQRRLSRISAGILLIMGLTVTLHKEAMADWNKVPTANINISASYDDNVTAESNGLSDIVTRITPRLGLLLEQEVTKINMAAYTSGELFSKNSNLNFASYGLSASLAHRFSPLDSFNFRESTSYTPETQQTAETVQNEEGEVETLITVRRGARISQGGSVGWSHQFSVLTAVSIGYSNSFTFFRDPSEIDSTTHSGSLGLSRKLDRSTSVNWGLHYSYFVNKGGADSQNANTSVGLSRSLSPSWNLSGNIGVNYTFQVNSYMASLAGGLRLSKTVSDQLRWNLGYSAHVSPSGGVSGDVVRNQVVDARINEQVTRRLSVNGTAQFGNSESVFTNDVSIISWNAGGGLNYRITQNISLGANYRHSQQISRGNSGSDLVRNAYFVSLSAALL
jgi:opacity protein-like surface antigen